ncbi:DUF4174 domain-containing protein [Altibacter lentus]|uniref:DUF4174 domain-containing protein n=1 Tax=Altibacter lentus TaxID=1223410 RepID=UPI000553A87B|nr:DUF4174 domain-containing protein [Altibacter lentus]
MKFLMVIYMAFTFNAFAQHLDKHQWSDRLILVFSPTSNDPMALEQLQELQNKKDGLTERKIFIYHIFDNGYRSNFSTESRTPPAQLEVEDRFKVMLVGLDGSEKFSADAPQKADVFLDLIDAMPMRQAELKNNEEE